MIISEVVGFLYMSKDILSVDFIIVRSRKINLFPCSRSSVKLRFRVTKRSLFLLLAPL